MMTAEQLLKELTQRGVRLKVDDGRIRYTPRSHVPDDLVLLLREHKVNLMRLLDVSNVAAQNAATVYVYETPFKPEQNGSSVDVVAAEAGNQPSAERDSTAIPTAYAEPTTHIQEAGVDSEELPDWPAPPCHNCSSLELWEDASGRWRCMYCDPPEAARRLRQLAMRIRARERRPGGIS